MSLGYIQRIEQGVAGKRIGNQKLNALASALGVGAEQLEGNAQQTVEDERPSSARVEALLDKIELLSPEEQDEVDAYIDFRLKRSGRG